MYVQPHDLDHEFPEYRDLIHRLQAEDAKFAELFASYEAVNRQIVDVEENDKPYEDFEFEALKKKRLHLKDEVYAVLRARAQ